MIRNDTLTVRDIRTMQPSHIILSPGPGYPADAGICETVVRELFTEFPILGVCLGHQAICEAFGATIAHARQLMHGKTSRIRLNEGVALFAGLGKEIEAARYHSLIAKRDTLPDCLTITAEDAIGEVMGVKHAQYPTYGLQFHPESVLTPDGLTIMKNFLEMEGPTC